MMKLKLRIMFILLGVILLIPINGVLAQITGTLKMEYVDGYYYTMTSASGSYMSYEVPFYSINDDVTYCIEPGVDIISMSYVGVEDISLSPYSSEITKKMELIGHYGYDYPGHQNIRYRMAAQALIWSLVDNRQVDFWTEQYGYGSVIDVSKEKEEIMALVESHDVKPSFDGTTKRILYNKEAEFTDTNGVLNKFEVVDDGGNEVRIVDNTLYVTSKIEGNSQIKLKYKNYDDERTIIYTGLYSSANQKLAKFRSSSEVTATLNIRAVKGVITIEKFDADTKKKKMRGDATLEGAVYGVYDANGNLLDKIVLDAIGHGSSIKLDDPNNLTIKELSSPNGYLLNAEVYKVDIPHNGADYLIYVYDKIIEKEFSITKYYGSKGTGIFSTESNVTFDIYLKSSGKLLQSITTNANGYASCVLPYGTYIVKQRNTKTGYLKADDFTVVVDDDGEEKISKVVYNYANEGKIKIVKVDLDTGERINLAGLKFRIQNKETSEDVCPANSQECVFVTDENGEIITDKALFGDYIISEIKNQDMYGYVWNNLEYEVHLGEGTVYQNDGGNSAYLEVKFPNQRVTGELEIVKYGEDALINEEGIYYKEIKLSGVSYNIYALEDIYVNGVLVHKKDSLVGNLVTDEDGVGRYDGLAIGSYYLKEMITDDNHVIDDEVYPFTVDYQGSLVANVLVKLELKNYYKKGTIEISKTDVSTGEMLDGAVIGIYTDDDEEVFIGETNEEGILRLDDIAKGDYYFIEITAPDGYILDNERHYFQIKDNGEIVKANITNKKITGNLKVKKRDFLTGNYLAGAEFMVYNSSNDIVMKCTTDSNGECLFENILYGEYYLKEITAPDGYILSDEIYSFEIDEDGELIEVDYTNKLDVIVPNTKKNDNMDYFLVAGFIFGLGLVIYATLFNKKN